MSRQDKEENFKSICYLENGCWLQKEAYKVLTENIVMDKLADFQPILVGTIPINLAIVCSFERKEIFEEEIQKHFCNYSEFSILEKTYHNELTVVVQFNLDVFPLEIFAQIKPSTYQIAFQHMQIEHKVLIKEGEQFRNEIIRLNESGLKTEPAFAQLLNLKGDPYNGLLDYGKQQKII